MKKYFIDRDTIARTKKYVDRYNEAVRKAGGIVPYMTGQSFRRSEPTNTQESEKKQNE